MTALIATINILLILLALVGFLLTIFGTPVGIILLFIYLYKGGKLKKNRRIKKWIFLMLSGIPILVIVALLNMIYVLVGVNPLVINESLSLPSQ